MLNLKNLTKSFLGQDKPVLKGITLSIQPGEFCIIIGNNGSGKSTLMRSISGESSPDEGQVQLGNQDLTKKPLYQRASLISSVTQDTHKGTIAEMSLLENMVLSMLCGHRSNLKPYTDYRPIVLDTLRSLDLGLEDYCDGPMSALSGGQRQMVATLMAFASHPKILLLDEHTSALDPKTHRAVMEYSARTIAKQGITTLMITHRLEDALFYGTRLIVLSHGSVRLDVQGDAKKALRTSELMELFHEHDESMMLKGATS